MGKFQQHWGILGGDGVEIAENNCSNQATYFGCSWVKREDCIYFRELLACCRPSFANNRQVASFFEGFLCGRWFLFQVCPDVFACRLHGLDAHQGKRLQIDVFPGNLHVGCIWMPIELWSDAGDWPYFFFEMLGSIKPINDYKHLKT